MNLTSKKKKILFITRLFYPHIGGVAKHVLKLSEEFVLRGYSVTVLTEKYENNLLDSENIGGVEIIRIPITNSLRAKKFYIWSWIIKNRKFFKNYNIIHIHDVFYWILPILIGLNRESVFITFHGYESYPIKLKNKIQRKIAELYCHANICVGKFIEKWYGTKADSIIYGAVEENKNSTLIPTKKYDFIFWGRLDIQTGILQYYKAFLKLKKEHKNYTFRIIGDGKLKKNIKEGNISSFKPDINSDLYNSRFVFVSRYLSMLEAMIGKRLVFAVYDNNIKKDYLIDSPFAEHVEICSSSDKIVERVNYYKNNPDEEKIKIEKAYTWARSKTWKKLADLYLELWNK